MHSMQSIGSISACCGEVSLLGEFVVRGSSVCPKPFKMQSNLSTTNCLGTPERFTVHIGDRYILCTSGTGTYYAHRGRVHTVHIGDGYQGWVHTVYIRDGYILCTSGTGTYCVHRGWVHLQ